MRRSQSSESAGTGTCGAPQSKGQIGPRAGRTRLCRRGTCGGERLSWGITFLLFAGAIDPVLLAEVPYPSCASSGCGDPYGYSSYLRLKPGQIPNDFSTTSSQFWKYSAENGMNIVQAWQSTTGRPDVVIAVLDSGVKWDQPDLALKCALNAGELPFPDGSDEYDRNRDGVVNVADYAGVPDGNGNGLPDPQDLLLFYSDGLDNDRNGFVDDIAGWDFFQDDNDPFDDTDSGHGTGQALDQAGEANNGTGFPGIAPSAMFLPLRVSDSFIAVDTNFSQAVVYAVENRVDLISEALGAISASASTQEAIDFAYCSGIPIVASAADEQSLHHNFPSGFEHTIWVNSIRNGDGTLVRETNDYTLLNGCTNYGGQAWATIPSTACSSEATARAAGLVALLISHGKNLIDRGLLAPYPGLETPFSAEEVRQIVRLSAMDIDHSENPVLTMDPILSNALSVPQGPRFTSGRFSTQKGWDQYTGYGRPNAARMLEIAEKGIPPEADLSGNLAWFDTVDPRTDPTVPIIGSAAAVRSGAPFDYIVDVGCGVQPTEFFEVGKGSSPVALDQKPLVEWNTAETAKSCGFDHGSPPESPNDQTVTIRLRVIDASKNTGEDRRTLAIHSDPTHRFPPKTLRSSGEAPPGLGDIDRDGVLDIIWASSSGAVQAFCGRTGRQLRGFPAFTRPLPVHHSKAYLEGRVRVPREAVVAAPAVGDLDGDGRLEIIVATVEGRVYCFDDHGRRRAGFPVSVVPEFSRREIRDKYNDLDPGILSAPTLADLDGPSAGTGLEIILGGMDGHLYAWDSSGRPVSGFPVKLADPAMVDVEPGTGRVIPRPGVDARSGGAKIIGSPAVGDLDGDGRPEIVVSTNEQYGGSALSFSPAGSTILAFLANLSETGEDLLGLDLKATGRVYVVQPDGYLNPGGPFRPGWPVPVPLLMPGVLPTIAAGVPGSPALADLEGTGQLAIAVFSAIGPVMLFDADGDLLLGSDSLGPRPLAIDFPGFGFPLVPPEAGSADAPFFGAVGSGAFGDLDGDGLPEYLAPTVGLRKILDLAGPANQSFSDHQICAWNPRDGSLRPGFPVKMDDLQFLTSPVLADVDGDGRAEVLAGSGGFLLRAYRIDGTEPPAWPKFTHGWIIAAPAAGDVDGDGLIELVAVTREGKLYVWDTPTPATEQALPWQGFGRDGSNTQNLNSGLSPLAGKRHRLEHLCWLIEATFLRYERLFPFFFP